MAQYYVAVICASQIGFKMRETLFARKAKGFYGVFCASKAAAAMANPNGHKFAEFVRSERVSLTEI